MEGVDCCCCLLGGRKKGTTGLGGLFDASPRRGLVEGLSVSPDARGAVPKARSGMARGREARNATFHIVLVAMASSKTCTHAYTESIGICDDAPGKSSLTKVATYEIRVMVSISRF